MSGGDVRRVEPSGICTGRPYVETGSAGET
jgi:hypothetical protein